jgi:hypothetical protein
MWVLGFLSGIGFEGQPSGGRPRRFNQPDAGEAGYFW